MKLSEHLPKLFVLAMIVGGLGLVASKYIGASNSEAGGAITVPTLTPVAVAGKAVFDANCAVCHGESGEGMRELGAPKLNDSIWLFGGDKETIVETISKSRGGVMPAWGGRLDDVTLKQLTIYVHSLGGGE